MQIVSEPVKQLVESNAPVQLHLSLDGNPVNAKIISAVYAPVCAGGEGFSIGNACSARLDLTLSGTDALFDGRPIAVTWDADGTEYPLFSGAVDSVRSAEGKVTLTAYDALYSAGAGPYVPTAEVLTACTCADLLRDIASQLGVAADPGALADAQAVPLPDGASNLKSGTSLSRAAGYAAMALGGNAVINRAGALAVARYADVGFSTDPYASGAEADGTDYTVTGLTFTRTDTITETDSYGTATQHEQKTDFEAGDGSLGFENPLATQAMVDHAFAAVEGVTLRGGAFSIPGGLLLEPGDLFCIDSVWGSYTVGCMSLSMEYDGGVKTAVRSYGTPPAQSSPGPLTRAVNAVAADVANVKTVVAENLKTTNAAVANLRADKADVGAMTAAQADIAVLTTEQANVRNLLAGNAGVGVLEAIHLTGENAVIDDAIITDAMIAELSAGKLTAGTIYTSLIKIASDQDENLVMDGATIQVKDAKGVLRVQIGKDGAGDYNLALWDAKGSLLWDASGVYAAGLHDGIIRDVAVAADANISGTKLNIPSVASRLTEDGTLIVDSGQVTLDGTTLTAAYKTLTQADADAAKKTSALETEFKVVQGQVASKVWQSDIEAAVDPLSTEVTTLSDQYSTLEQTVQGVTTRVGAVETTATGLGTRLTAAESAIQQQADQIALKVSRSEVDSAVATALEPVTAELDLKIGRDENDQIVSMIEASADVLRLTGNRLIVDSDNFKLSEDGTLTATNGTFRGEINANSGTIGGFEIDGEMLIAQGITSGSTISYPMVIDPGVSNEFGFRTPRFGFGNGGYTGGMCATLDADRNINGIRLEGGGTKVTLDGSGVAVNGAITSGGSKVITETALASKFRWGRIMATGYITKSGAESYPCNWNSPDYSEFLIVGGNYGNFFETIVVPKSNFATFSDGRRAVIVVLGANINVYPNGDNAVYVASTSATQNLSIQIFAR